MKHAMALNLKNFDKFNKGLMEDNEMPPFKLPIKSYRKFNIFDDSILEVQSQILENIANQSGKLHPILQDCPFKIH